ncbi:MAG: DUF523 domain-containing protein [Planctomycetota bacterium]|nr:DUF523 domain-containing protein [Planctomycetota bacterium]
MKIVHHPERLEELPTPSQTEPWRILISGCMAGWGCGVDGTDYGMKHALADFQGLGTAQLLPYCPEDVGLGTPRTMPDLHGGDGFGVLDGSARVLDEHGGDLTEGMLAGARAMVAFARENKVQLAILTDMSGACGTQVISDGCRFDEPRRYRRGMGVAAAMLVREGFPVVSSRDFATLGKIRAHLDSTFEPDPKALDHHQQPWVIENLPES